MTYPDFFAVFIGALGPVIYIFPLENHTIDLIEFIIQLAIFSFLFIIIGVRCTEISDLVYPVVQMKSMLPPPLKVRR